MSTSSPLTGADLVFLMGGQGSQYFGMGRDLHLNSPVFRTSMETMDEYVRRAHGTAVLDYIYDPRRTYADACDDLVATSAAIVMVEVSLFRELAAQGLHPTAVIGSSLGELAAIAALGYVDQEVVLDVAIRIARTLGTGDGGMLAVLGDPALHATMPALDDTAIASVNHRGHFVLAGPDTALVRAERALGERGAVVQRLPVRAAFHSSFIEYARDAVLEAARGLWFDRADSILVSSATAGRVRACTPHDCWDVLRSPIRFADAVSTVPASSATVHLDLTPSSTLAAIMRGSHPHRLTQQVITPFHNEPARLHAFLPAGRGAR